MFGLSAQVEETDPVLIAEKKERNDKLTALLDARKKEVEAATGGKSVIGYIMPVSETDNAFLFLRRMGGPIKRRAIDKLTATEEIMSTGKFIIDSCMIKDHSDPRFQDDNDPDNADLIATACLSVVDEIKFYSGVIKKK